MKCTYLHVDLDDRRIRALGECTWIAIPFLPVMKRSITFEQAPSLACGLSAGRYWCANMVM